MATHPTHIPIHNQRNRSTVCGKLTRSPPHHIHTKALIALTLTYPTQPYCWLLMKNDTPVWVETHISNFCSRTHDIRYIVRLWRPLPIGVHVTDGAEEGLNFLWSNRSGVIAICSVHSVALKPLSSSASNHSRIILQKILSLVYPICCIHSPHLCRKYALPLQHSACQHSQ